MTHDSWATSQPKKLDTLSHSVFFHNTRLHNSQAWVPLRLLQHGGIVSCHCVGGSLKVLFHVAHHPSQRQLHSLEGWIHGDRHSFLIWEARLHENLNHLTILANLISKHLEGCDSQAFDLASLLMLHRSAGRWLLSGMQKDMTISEPPSTSICPVNCLLQCSHIVVSLQGEVVYLPRWTAEWSWMIHTGL